MRPNQPIKNKTSQPQVWTCRLRRQDRNAFRGDKRAMCGCRSTI